MYTKSVQGTKLRIGTDTMTIGCQHCIWGTKNRGRETNSEHERAQRAAEKRRRDLSRIDQEKQQVEAKVKKLNESGEPIRNISFSQEDKEVMKTNTESEDSNSLE